MATRRLHKTVTKLKRKVKAGLKRVTKKMPALKRSRKPAGNSSIVQQLVVEKAKFSVTQKEPPKCADVFPQPVHELPSRYNIDRLVLQVRDPWWLHAWWEEGEGSCRLKREFSPEGRARRILRVYDVTGVDFSGNNAHSSFDIELNEYAQSWYIKVSPGRFWCVDLGLLLTDGRFITLLRSNIVSTPVESPSTITDEEWMVPDELFMRLYGMGIGSGRASPSKGWQARIGWASMSSMSSPVKKPHK